MNMLEDFINF